MEYPIEFHKNRISVNSKKICGTNNYTVNPLVRQQTRELP